MSKSANSSEWTNFPGGRLSNWKNGRICGSEKKQRELPRSTEAPGTGLYRNGILIQKIGISRRGSQKSSKSKSAGIGIVNSNRS